MNKYVALLRGINVGGNNKIAMAELKDCFEAQGYEQVTTYINSGNVIFATKTTDTTKLTSDIEQAILTTFGFSIRVVLRDQQTIAAICAAVPAEWSNDKDQKTDVMFLWPDFAGEETLDLLTIKPKVDTVRYLDGDITWHLEKKNYSKSGMHKLIGTKVYKHMTVRNINTVRKLHSLF
jgi:uncharacterized protein (DUF1697 family)